MKSDSTLARWLGRRPRSRGGSTWDLTALLNAADPKAPLAERHLWLIRLTEWLRQSPLPPALAEAPAAPAPATGVSFDPVRQATPRPILRLRHLLRVLDQQPVYRDRVKGLLQAFWLEVDAAALLADYGFSPRMALRSEVTSRIRRQLLPATPETADLAELFDLLLRPSDARWLATLDPILLARLGELLAPSADDDSWRAEALTAVNILVSAVHGAAFSPPLRKRMSPGLLKSEPFRQLAGSADRLRIALLDGEQAAALQEASYLRALLDTCRRATASITEHLEDYGVSVDIVFEMDQLQARTRRIELLLDCLLAPDPLPELHRLVLELVQLESQQISLRQLLSRHYSLLARQVAERNAETGEHYIARDRREYRAMLGRAAGGGAVLAGTTFIKFGLGALGLTAFWAGMAFGLNYAASFVLIMWLHYTVATKQPAMTAPAMAARLGELESPEAVESFVDKLTQLIRSQMAGIFGNLMACAPIVLAVQFAVQAITGDPLVSRAQAEYSLHALTLVGPTALYAAFTGVLLFASSLIAGWTENWFVFHRLDSAIAWNPRIVARLGAARAQRWSTWWRHNVSSVAANVSLGLMLGLMPALLGFLGLPLDVRHVTLSTGQVAAALGALGTEALHRADFWWCVAGIAATGALNLLVSFVLALKVALRSRDIRIRERSILYRAVRRRLLRRPLSFLWPSREAKAEALPEASA